MRISPEILNHLLVFRGVLGFVSGYFLWHDEGKSRGFERDRSVELSRSGMLRFDFMRSARSIVIGTCALLSIAAAGCGGGSSGSSSNPPPTNVSISISPSSATIGFGSTAQFTATVSGSTNTAVTWTVTDVNGGTSNVGAISSAGLYTAPSATSASLPSLPQLVSVTAGQTASANVAVPQLNPVNEVTVTATSQADTTKSASATVTLSGLSIIAVGQCTVSGSNINCTAGVTGTEISRGTQGGQTVYLFIAGYGIVPGTTYSISGNGTDIVVTQPTSNEFSTATDGTPVVYFPVVVSRAAALGPRNIVVTNQANELSAFPGGLQITP